MLISRHRGGGNGNAFTHLLYVPSNLNEDTLSLLEGRLLLLEGEQMIEVAAWLLVIHLKVGVGNHKKTRRTTVHHQVPGMGIRHAHNIGKVGRRNVRKKAKFGRGERSEDTSTSLQGERPSWKNHTYCRGEDRGHHEIQEKA
jgi:hypothetical protein